MYIKRMRTSSHRRRLPDADPWRLATKRTDRVGDVAQLAEGAGEGVDCVVIAPSQMSRECEKRPDKRGQLSDLRGQRRDRAGR